MLREIRLSVVLLLISLSSFAVADLRAQSKTTYQDNVFPLVENYCAKCHNPDKKKADLDLTTYAGVMKGSGSGAIVQSGSADASKLYRVLTHQEEPEMPPNKPKLPDKELDVFKRWINDGLLESSGSKAIAASKPLVDLTLKLSNDGKPTGPAAMPTGLSTQPLVKTERMGPVLSVASSPWAPALAITGQKQIFLYHAETLVCLGVLPFTNGQPCLVKFSRSGSLLLAAGGQAGKSGRVALWDVASGKPMTVLGGEFDTVLAADISPDQTRVALGGPSRLLKIHSTATGEVEHKIKKHTDWVTAIAFSPSGQYVASGDRNGNIHVWDPENGQEVFALSGHSAGIHGLSWRSDSKVLASCSEDGSIRTWEMEGGKPVKTWPAHPGGALSVAYSQDGQIASCGRNGKVMTWDGDGNKKKAMESENELPVSVTFSHDGKRVIASFFNGKTLAWTAKDGTRVGEMDANPLQGSGSTKMASADKR